MKTIVLTFFSCLSVAFAFAQHITLSTGKSIKVGDSIRINEAKRSMDASTRFFYVNMITYVPYPKMGMNTSKNVERMSTWTGESHACYVLIQNQTYAVTSIKPPHTIYFTYTNPNHEYFKKVKYSVNAESAIESGEITLIK